MVDFASYLFNCFTVIAKAFATAKALFHLVVIKYCFTELGIWVGPLNRVDPLVATFLAAAFLAFLVAIVLLHDYILNPPFIYWQSRHAANGPIIYY